MRDLDLVDMKIEANVNSMWRGYEGGQGAR